MSKRKNRRRPTTQRPRAAAQPQSRLEDSRPAESRLAETATVAWMLSMLVTLGAEIALALAALWRWLQPDNQLPAMFAEVFGLCALVVGAVSLLLAVVVLRSRRVMPPRGVTVVALVAGALPLVVLGYGACYRLWH